MVHFLHVRVLCKTLIFSVGFTRDGNIHWPRVRRMLDLFLKFEGPSSTSYRFGRFERTRKVPFTYQIVEYDKEDCAPRAGTWAILLPGKSISLNSLQ